MGSSDTIPETQDTTSRPNGVRHFSQEYPVWLCDVWGVVHDGETAFVDACAALRKHRLAGGTVVLITNAPRPSAAIIPQLAAMKVDPQCYDAVVSSGDVTRHLVGLERGRNVYHLGPAKDLSLIADMPVNFTGLDDADVVLCSGLMDDEVETPESFRPMLLQMSERRLPMICANPDRVVRKGRKLLPCAGALAAIYGELGGEVAMAGKPFAPIYDEALRVAARLRGHEIKRDQVMAIGDGLPTDAKGAADYGLGLLFVIDGIHEAELTGSQGSIRQYICNFVPGVKIVGVMHGLSW